MYHKQFWEFLWNIYNIITSFCETYKTSNKIGLCICLGETLSTGIILLSALVNQNRLKCTTKMYILRKFNKTSINAFKLDIDIFIEAMHSVNIKFTIIACYKSVPQNCYIDLNFISQHLKCI